MSVEHRSRWSALAFVCVFALATFWFAQYFKKGDAFYQASQSPLPGELQRVDCWFATAHDARCAWLHPVRQNLARDTALPVVILSPEQRSSRTASIYLSGGPGGQSYLFEDAIEGWRDWMHSLGLDHDLVLYDTRGTGLSRPMLHCPEYLSMQRRQLSASFETPDERRVEWQAAQSVLLRCAERIPLADRTAALVSTRQHARDLLDLIVALKRDHGYRDVVLYGVSYGSRLAAWTSSEARTPVEQVSRIVLDSYYPPGMNLNLRTARTWREVLADFSGQCSPDAECDFANEVLAEKIVDLIESNPAGQDLVTIDPPSYASDQSEIELRRDADNLIYILMHSLSTDTDTEMLVRRLDEALAGKWPHDWNVLASSYLEAVLDETFGNMAFELAECADNGQPSPAELEATRRDDPALAKFFESPPGWDGYCDRLGKTDAVLTPRTNRTPALVVGMELDPVTPWRAARQALTDLPRANWRLLAGAGHGVADQDECGATAIGAFMNSGTMSGFDACDVIDRRDAEVK